MPIENLKYNLGFFGWCATRDAEFHSKESRPHFDISQKSMIVWKDESELIERLKRRIEKKMIFLVVLTICKWYTQLDKSGFDRENIEKSHC